MNTDADALMARFEQERGMGNVPDITFTLTPEGLSDLSRMVGGSWRDVLFMLLTLSTETVLDTHRVTITTTRHGMHEQPSTPGGATTARP